MYAVMKLVHVLSVVLFLGNIITAIFWKRWADRSGDPRIMARTCAGLIQADRFFTMPAVTLLVLSGFAAAGMGKWPVFSTSWILWSLILLVISAAAYMAGVVPAQKKMAALTRTWAAGTAGQGTVERGRVDGGTVERGSAGQTTEPGIAGTERTRYAELNRAWNLWGTIALVAPLVAAVLMVLKP